MINYYQQPNGAAVDNMCKNKLLKRINVLAKVEKVSQE